MQCVDKNGHCFEVAKFSQDQFPSLEAMYKSFYPKGKFQGMPPLDDDASRRWVLELLKNGENYLARQDGSTVGHVVILPDHGKKDAEYLIFVSHPYRGKGIGTRLTDIVLQRAREIGIRTIWLVVGTLNFQAIGLYKKFGFGFSSDDLCECERKMTLNLGLR